MEDTIEDLDKEIEQNFKKKELSENKIRLPVPKVIEGMNKLGFKKSANEKVIEIWLV